MHDLRPGALCMPAREEARVMIGMYREGVHAGCGQRQGSVCRDLCCWVAEQLCRADGGLHQRELGLIPLGEEAPAVGGDCKPVAVERKACIA